MNERRPSIAHRAVSSVNWTSIPVILATTISAIAVVAGVVVNVAKVMDVPTQLQSHITAESTWHANATTLAAQARRLEAEDRVMLEALVRGKCLESSRGNLARQGLVLKCRELGIEPGVDGAPAVVTPVPTPAPAVIAPPDAVIPTDTQPDVGRDE